MALIEREALLVALNSDDTLKHARHLMRLYIQEAPAIDTIHAAGGCYCRECRNYVDAYGRGKMMCMRPIQADDYLETGYMFPLEVETKEDDFCNYGEPREEQGDE